MKIMKGLWLTFMLLFFFSDNVFAAEEKGDVNAKYNYVKGDTFYDYDFKNNKINVNLDGISFDIITDNDNDNGLKVTIIPTKDDALNWINNISDLNNIKAFYVFFDNMPIGNIKVSLSIKEKTIENISTNGEILNAKNSLLSIKNKSYIVFGNKEVDSTINFKLNGNGSIIIDGTIYSENFTYKIKETNLNLIIKPNSEYEIESVISDSLDITNLVKGGFLTIDDLKGIKDIIVSYKKKESLKENIYYKVIGTITKDGIPLSNAKLELYSKILKTTTDSNGNFIFEKVPSGFHSLTVYKDDKVIGYIEFVLKSTIGDSIDVLDKNNLSQISIGKAITDFNLLLNIDAYNKIQVNSVNAIKTSNNYKWLLPCLSVLSVLIISIIIYLIRRNQKNSN